MDKFHSIVLHVMADSDGVLPLHVAFVEDDMLEFYDPAPGINEGHGGDFFNGFDIEGWGWTDGGLERILIKQGCGPILPSPLFFRGAALFSNFDDAKNDYLMAPMYENCTGSEQSEDTHVPFGMVIPAYRDNVTALQPYTTQRVLTHVTIILYWQEQ